jgi:thiol-disulfide isomerase/thioredoxin
MAERRKLLLWTTAGAAVAVLLVIALSSVHSTAVGRRAPALPGERLAGPPVAHPHGPALVVFWASWCDPCVREASALERVSLSRSGRDRVIGVNWSDNLPGARSFIRRYAWTFSNLRDGEGTVGNAYRLTGLPTSFLIDASGHIRQVLRGPQDERSLARALSALG